MIGGPPTATAQGTPAPPPERLQDRRGNFIDQTSRPLRYFPDGHDFVITNGVEFFNRPLYGGNTAFRADGGDKPEFSLYLPGRGGNLRFGLRTLSTTLWLHDAASIVTRYRPGALLYDITDPSLDGGRIELTAVGLPDREGLLVRARWHGTSPAPELLWAFGGANGMRGRRSGDIGCEDKPVREFFQLSPEQCEGDQVVVAENRFELTGRKAVIQGTAPAGATHWVAAAEDWESPNALLERQGAASISRPLVVGALTLSAGQLAHLAVEVASENTSPLSDQALAEAFDAAEARRQHVAERVRVHTPDPFINAAATALNIAADAVWDESRRSFMHGAVAWRNRLLGWRGVYSGDALGWHERTRAHLDGFAREQNTNAIPATLPAPEASAHLARNETALHSNGNMTAKHYDMNLVAIDAFFRHLLWTGDLEFARQYWPVLERHLAWERRLFRREFGPDTLPLYEGYACFWASDDVAYNGGGSTIGSAYNHYHNKMAARLASLLGKDPTPYLREAVLIAKAMRQQLWLPDQQWFAEYKDLLGLQLVHPSPGLWSIYHTIDSEVPTPVEAWQMTRFVDEELPHLPLSGPNVPPGTFTIPSSRWMPYSWSVNNVVMAEVTHTALACWQADRPALAWSLFKGALLDSMFLGLCPGNVGMCTEFDAYRHESQRDFADGVGATSRALIEGLFGIRPNALVGTLMIRPGFPPEWDQASLHHPDLDLEFNRTANQETLVVRQRFARPLELVLHLAPHGGGTADVVVNGIPTTTRWITNAPQSPRLEIKTDGQPSIEVRVTWDGTPPALTPALPLATETVPASSIPTPSQLHLDTNVNYDLVDLASVFNDRVTQIFRNDYLSPRSPFCSLATPRQGIGSWCQPTRSFEVDDSGLRRLARKGGGQFTLPNGVPLTSPPTPHAPNIAFVSQWDNYPTQLSIPLHGRAVQATLLMAGSTGPMQSRIDNGEVVVTYADGSTDRLPLHNPTTWWPIDQDYFIDDYAFRFDGPLPTRIDLQTGAIRVLRAERFKGTGGTVRGGAATVLEMPINPNKELKSLTVGALANEVVIGLMNVTLHRPLDSP